MKLFQHCIICFAFHVMISGFCLIENLLTERKELRREVFLIFAYVIFVLYSECLRNKLKDFHGPSLNLHSYLG